ncbi:MAG: exodeoxyribonuclease VII small subunit [Gracilibacteraceae bacterium]|jgi:exodeoxyribonuclease VII small subunit|nr:exodeoxyribonuclease VII small subunit [Gracilibacteraceae bacterium]
MTDRQAADKQAVDKQAAASFETGLERLQAIVTLLEDNQIPLAEALTLFEEGAGLLRYCRAELERAEEQVKVLTETDGVFHLTDLA